MGFWNKQETELHMTIGSDPSKIAVYTNWPYYVTRMMRCEGFTVSADHQPKEGGRLVEGVIDQSEYRYIWMRKNFGSDKGEEEFEQAKAKLAPAVMSETDFRLAAHERVTHFMALAIEPYWIFIETDSAVWQRRLSEHTYAVLVEERRYSNDDEGSPAMYQRYAFPRSLMTVRAARPQYTEEHRQALRERLASFKS
jgi:hypothetical protein